MPVSMICEGVCIAPYVWVAFRHLLPAGDEQLRVTSIFEPGEVPTCICTWQPHWEMPTAFVELRQRLAGPVTQLLDRTQSQVSRARISACCRTGPDCRSAVPGSVHAAGQDPIAGQPCQDQCMLRRADCKGALPGPEQRHV